MSGPVGGGDNSQEIDLNLAPIIDSFVVLIAFMLISASFLAIGILDAGISAGGAASKNATPPPIGITVKLKQGNRLNLSVTGKQRLNITLPALKGEEIAWDHESLTHQLTKLKGRWKTVNAVTLMAEDSVEYRDVIQTMDVIRKIHPAVLLGGF